MGGEFYLRIEDTDRARSTKAATEAILDGMTWLGLSHDGDIVYQSQNMDVHIKAAHDLLASGHAYKCYLTKEELETERERQSRAFRSPYRDPKTAPQPRPDNAPYVVRFRIPEGHTAISDHVQGDITWQNEDFDDLVLLRADGTPTYMLAVVVDDHNMGITHIIRGDDHLINAGRQSLIYKALGWDVPEFAHVPLIHGPDGKKLSKRHGALGVEAYREAGYLPEGLRNYLLKLGWSHGDKELFFDEEAIEAFRLSGLNNAPARLDFDKMGFINGRHLENYAANDLLNISRPFLEDSIGKALSPEQERQVIDAAESLKPRAQTLKELSEQAAYFLQPRPLEFSSKAKKSLRKSDAISHLRALIHVLEPLEETEWNADKLQMILNNYAQDNNVGFGKFGQPLRAALTAGAPSPDLNIVLSVIGQRGILARINDVIKASETGVFDATSYNLR